MAIVREEMDKIGQEFYLPALHPRELWEASGRWSVMGDNLFRLKDRKGADLCLGMTHEEVMTDIARKELRSYKQLPQIWYQIQSKFRDEPRPRSGLLRVRQFIMKDSYSFDIDAAGLDVSYQKHHDAYCRIFDRCGLKYMVIEADSGAMGGSQSQEFMVRTPAGEDQVVSCENCNYAANLEKATSKLEAGRGPHIRRRRQAARSPHSGHEDDRRCRAFPRRLAEEQDQDAGADARGNRRQRPAKPQPVPSILLMRGDHQMNEAKLASAVGGKETRPMQEEEIKQLFRFSGRIPGPSRHRLGQGSERRRPPDPAGRQSARRPQEPDLPAPTKRTITSRTSRPGADFQPTAYADLRTVTAGEACPNCGAPLRIDTAVEIGHIFKLGYKYSESMGARVLDRNGKEVMPIMGSYGIGIERILTAAIEQSNDENGFWLPPSIAPFEIVVMSHQCEGRDALEAPPKISQPAWKPLVLTCY